MDVIPAVNTSYLAYLQSPKWRKTRNLALGRAHFTCQRCGAKRNVQVHHRSYERLGCEAESDLEVLCRDCHEGEHVRQMHDAGGNSRLYLKIANDVLRAHPFDTIADLSDAVKTECARLRIPNDNHQIDKALSLVCGTSFGKERTNTIAQIIEAKDEGRPFTEQEAREMIRTIFGQGLGRLCKEMPRAKASKIDIYGPVPREDFGDHDRY